MKQLNTCELELNADPVLQRSEHVVTIACEISREPVDDQSDDVAARASERVETRDDLAIEVEAYEKEDVVMIAAVHEGVVGQQEEEMLGSLCSDFDVGSRDSGLDSDDSGCELEVEEGVDDRGELDTSVESGCELEFDEMVDEGVFREEGVAMKSDLKCVIGDRRSDFGKGVGFGRKGKDGSQRWRRKKRRRKPPDKSTSFYYYFIEI